MQSSGCNLCYMYTFSIGSQGQQIRERHEIIGMNYTSIHVLLISGVSPLYGAQTE